MHSVSDRPGARSMVRASVCRVFALALLTASAVGGAIPVALAQSAAAARPAPLDCGDPPAPAPAIPDGRDAGRDEMLAGIRRVREYSHAVDEWLACKDRRAAKVFQWMDEDERARWDEDLDKVHRARVEVQRRMNSEIRTFNARQKARSGKGVDEGRTSRRRQRRRH